MPRRNSICGKQSAAEYTQKFKHLNRDRIRKIHCNLLKNFPLQGFNKHPRRFRCSGKGEYLNLAARQDQAAKPLTTNVLQEFQQLCPWFRSQTGLEHHRMQIRHGSTSERGIPERCNRTAHASEPEQNTKNHCNSLRYFLLRDFSKHLHWFRCSGKGEYLNLAARLPAAKPLTTSILQNFRQLCPRFRSQQGLECRRLHICPGGTSERGIPERCNRAAQASEPEQNPKNSLQLIEILSVARF